jgi:hypothetical protein
MNSGKKIRWVSLLILAVLIKIFSLFPGAVEKYYSTGIYQFMARLLRILFGWIPFSIGDIFYAVIAVYLLINLISFIKKIFKKQIRRGSFFSFFKKIIFIILVIYVTFNVLWGLNYNRKGIAYQLGLDVQPYNTAELTDITRIIVKRLNALDSLARLERNKFGTNHYLFSGATDAYKKLETTIPIFSYRSPSVKPSIFSYFGNYFGFTGYYNPFSGEAQVNTTVPFFIEPFTTCHEIGHQLGYAKENEANFSGYLSAKSSDNNAFKYSVYFDFYIYAARELYIRDSSLLVPLRESLHPAVRKDFRDLRDFFDKYQNPFEPYIRKLYGKYLKANEQPQGIMSYNEVIEWLIAYYKKFGEEAV